MSRISFDEEHFMVSYELLQILQWFLEHEQESLKELLASAMSNGLQHEIDRAMRIKNVANDVQPLKSSIIDFFSLVETLVYEIKHEQDTQQATQRALIPMIDKIDQTYCADQSAVKISIAKATAAAKNKTGKSPKDVLCKELLKRWKPSKKMAAH